MRSYNLGILKHASKSPFTKEFSRVLELASKGRASENPSINNSTPQLLNFSRPQIMNSEVLMMKRQLKMPLLNRIQREKRDPLNKPIL